MSTTFEIYPQTHAIPTFGQVLDLTASEIHRRLAQLQIHRDIRLTSTIRSVDENSIVIPSRGEKFLWPHNIYLWFGIEGVDGGTDGYFQTTDDLTRDVWSDYFTLPQFARRKTLALECLSIGHYWSFRRSMGQLAITNLLYGILSGCIAILTDGLIMSDDSAWEWEKMPYTGDELLSDYFVPDRTDDPEYRDWAERCLAGISENLPG